MGGSSSKSKTTTRSTTTYTVGGDVGLTGQQAVDALGVLTAGAVEQQRISAGVFMDTTRQASSIFLASLGQSASFWQSTSANAFNLAGAALAQAGGLITEAGSIAQQVAASADVATTAVNRVLLFGALALGAVVLVQIYG